MCACLSSIQCTGNADAFSKFSEIRQNCSALRDILIPDHNWSSYAESCLSAPDEAHHRPISWLAFRRGCLANLTGPVHQILLEGKPATTEVSNQYKSDLMEKWIFASDYRERFKSSRRFLGRLAELRFATLLANEGWDLLSLEAYGGKIDVRGRSPLGIPSNFEVKFLAREESRNELTVEALRSDGISSGFLSIYSQIDYLLCIIYEASCQLVRQAPDGAMIAALILEDYSAFDIQLNDPSWIEWSRPTLFRKDSQILPFLERFEEKNPCFEENLKIAFDQLAEIWILDFRWDFEIERIISVDPRAGKIAYHGEKAPRTSFPETS